MSGCHGCVLKIDIKPGSKKIVLAGNPNVGKSVIFNALTGMYVDVSNYPGTTLDISHGVYGKDTVIDTPGVYGISSFNDEERIARDIILEADLVLNVVDAVHLERDLFLTQQIIDTGVPVIVALNMLDEASRQGISIDLAKLSQMLGVPVIPTVAVTKEGFSRLKEALPQGRPGVSINLVSKLISLESLESLSQGDALLILEGDAAVAARHNMEPKNYREEIYLARRERVNAVTNDVIKENFSKASFTVHLGRLMMRPFTGIPFLLLTLYLTYKLIGVVIAGDVVGFTEETIMQGFYEPFIRNLVYRFVAADSATGTILTGEFGILTMTFTYVLGLLLPLVAGFYLILSLLEDSGYLPRIAALVDRLMNAVGLNGRAVIPLLLGFGCVTLATVVTRLLGSDRERRIAIFLLALAIPCSAQLGVITGMLAGLGPQYVSLYILVVFSIMAVVGTLLNYLLPGKSTDLLIDLPPIRLPRAGNVLMKTGVKTYQFLWEAAPIFAGGALFISLLQLTGVLVFLQEVLKPVTVGWLNLPKESATAFIMGIVRRDFGAAGLYGLNLEPMQTLVALVTLTLFVPCIAAMLVLIKERGKKEAPVVWLGSWFIAFFMGGLVAQINLAFPGHGPEAVGLFFLIFLGSTIMIVKQAQKLRYPNIPREVQK